MTRTPFLPGMEDAQAPPGLSGWDYALWRTERLPAKRLVLRALRAIAGSRAECSPTTGAIRSKIAELGHVPPTERGVNLHLLQLESGHHLIRRCVDSRAKSRRRIAFLFLGEGASDQRPWAQATSALPIR